MQWLVDHSESIIGIMVLVVWAIVIVLINTP